MEWIRVHIWMYWMPIPHYRNNWYWRLWWKGYEEFRRWIEKYEAKIDEIVDGKPYKEE